MGRPTYSLIDWDIQREVEKLLEKIIDSDWDDVVEQFAIAADIDLRGGNMRGGYIDYESKDVKSSNFDSKTWKMAERVAKILNNAAHDWYRDKEDYYEDFDEEVEVIEPDPIFAQDIIAMLLDETSRYFNADNYRTAYDFMFNYPRGLENVLDELFNKWYDQEAHEIY